MTNVFESWSQANIETFKLLVSKGCSIEDLEVIMNKSEEDIFAMADMLGLVVDDTRDLIPWSEDELRVLKETYSIETKQNLLLTFTDKSWEDIQTAANRMGYTRGDSPKYLSVKETRIVNNKTKFLEDQIDSLKSIIYTKNNSNIEIMDPEPPSYVSSNDTMFILFSDWHTFKRIDPATTRGYNAYDEQIFSKRLAKALDRNIKLIRERKPRAVRVNFMGDMMEGNIHETTNIYSTSRTMLLLKEYLVHTLKVIAAEATIEKVTAIVGNHSRLTPRVSHRNKVEETHECTVYEMVKADTSSFIENFVIPRAQYYTDVPYNADGNLSGVGYIFTHGDGFKGSSNNLAGYPGTNSKTILREADNQQTNAYLQQIGKVDIHYPVLPFLTLGACVCGHFHCNWDAPLLGTPARFIGMGSMCGVDEYASNVLAVGDQPSQLTFFTDQYGLLSDRIVIDVI